MGSRSKARLRAVEILYEAELRSVSALDVLAARQAVTDPPLNRYVATLVEGVLAHRERIDELLTTYAEGWPVDRMPPVDRCILRLGVYELLWEADVPDAVAVDEATTLAAQLSTEESPDFVNGLLGRLQRLGPSLSA